MTLHVAQLALYLKIITTTLCLLDLKMCNSSLSRAFVTTRAAVIWLVAVVYRLKYYFAWAISEAALIFYGFCFNGFDDKGEARWDRYANTHIRQVKIDLAVLILHICMCHAVCRCSWR